MAGFERIMMITTILVSLALRGATVPDLPPVGAHRAPGMDEAAILTTINALFAAFEAGDGTAMLKHVYAEGRITGVGKRPDGSNGARQRSFAEYASGLKRGSGFVERISRPMIKIDAVIAVVWAPFTIVADGKIKSCGFDHFDMVRDMGAWKVANLTFSTRTDCAPATR